MQPKTYKSPKIALLNIELELKSEKENAEIRLESVEVYPVSSFYLFSSLSKILFLSNKS